MSLRVSKGVRSIYDRIIHMFVDLQPEEETEARFGHMKGSAFVPGITEKIYTSLLSSFSKTDKWKKKVDEKIENCEKKQNVKLFFFAKK